MGGSEGGQVTWRRRQGTQADPDPGPDPGCCWRRAGGGGCDAGPAVPLPPPPTAATPGG